MGTEEVISKRSINYIRIGLLFLPIFFAAIDIYVSFEGEYSISVARYVDLSHSQAIWWFIVCSMFLTVSFLTCQFFSVSWFKSPPEVRTLKENSIAAINRALKIMFLVICVYKSVEIINFGVLEYFLSVRMGLTPIGFALYFVLIMFPFILAYELAKHGFSKSNLVCLAFLVMLNLVTGFRFLLVYGLAVIVIFNWMHIVRISKFKRVLFVLVFTIILGGYEIARHNLAAGDVIYEIPSLIERLNRTSPVNYLQLIESKDVSHSILDITKLWSLPVPSILHALGFNFDGFLDFNFNLHEISRPMFSDYLAWRGTPTYEATGFSISIISYSYVFQQELGVLIFAVFYGFFIALGTKLLSSAVYERKIIGSTLLVGCFLSNESVVEASSLLVFSLVFLSFLFFLVLLRRTIIGAQKSLPSIKKAS